MNSATPRRPPVGRTYGSAAEAYLGAVEAVLRSGEFVPPVRDHWSIGSRFGQAQRATIEIMGDAFSILDVSRPFVVTPIRTPRIAYQVGQILWTMAASDSLEHISFYNERGVEFSDDGESLNAAPGLRIFGASGGEDQLREVIDLLKSDPNSRRGQIVIARPNDNLIDTKDYSCIASIQFFVRRGLLECYVSMRSQSAYGVLPYDLSLLLALHRATAAELGIPAGTYHHRCASLHIYDERSDAEALLGAPAHSISIRGATSIREWRSLLPIEARIRESSRQISVLPLRDVAGLAPQGPQPGDDLVRVLLAYAFERRGLPAEASAVLEGAAPEVRDAFRVEAERGPRERSRR